MLCNCHLSFGFPVVSPYFRVTHSVPKPGGNSVNMWQVVPQSMPHNLILGRMHR